MGIELVKPSPDGSLRQGEILADIYEHIVDFPCDESSESSKHSAKSVYYPFIIILTQECDLNHDFLSRYPDDAIFPDKDMEKRFRDNPERYLLPHILVCVAQQENHIKIYNEMRSDIFRRVKNNQDMRFHHLVIGDKPEEENSSLDLYIDFKRTFSLPTSSVYRSVYQKPGRRIALVPHPHILDLSHRHSCYISRIPLP